MLADMMPGSFPDDAARSNSVSEEVMIPATSDDRSTDASENGHITASAAEATALHHDLSTQGHSSEPTETAVVKRPAFRSLVDRVKIMREVDFSKTTLVIAGFEKAHITLHTGLLTQVFGYFETAYSNNSYEARNNRFEFTTELPVVWDCISKWLYNNVIDYGEALERPRRKSNLSSLSAQEASLSERHSKTRQALIIELYTCADRLCSPLLKDTCITELCWELTCGFAHPLDVLDLHLAYSESSPDGNLCSALARGYALVFTSTASQKYSLPDQEAPLAFYRGLLKALDTIAHDKDSLSTFRICFYHEHEPSDPCPMQGISLGSMQSASADCAITEAAAPQTAQQGKMAGLFETSQKANRIVFGQPSTLTPPSILAIQGSRHTKTGLGSSFASYASSESDASPFGKLGENSQTSSKPPWQSTVLTPTPQRSGQGPFGNPHETRHISAPALSSLMHGKSVPGLYYTGASGSTLGSPFSQNASPGASVFASKPFSGFKNTPAVVSDMQIPLAKSSSANLLLAHGGASETEAKVSAETVKQNSTTIKSVLGAGSPATTGLPDILFPPGTGLFGAKPFPLSPGTELFGSKELPPYVPPSSIPGSSLFGNQVGRTGRMARKGLFSTTGDEASGRTTTSDRDGTHRSRVPPSAASENVSSTSGANTAVTSAHDTTGKGPFHSMTVTSAESGAENEASALKSPGILQQFPDTTTPSKDPSDRGPAWPKLFATPVAPHEGINSTPRPNIFHNSNSAGNLFGERFETGMMQARASLFSSPLLARSGPVDRPGQENDTKQNARDSEPVEEAL